MEDEEGMSVEEGMVGEEVALPSPSDSFMARGYEPGPDERRMMVQSKYI